MTFGFAARSCFPVIVSVLTTQSEGTERYCHAQTKLLYGLSVPRINRNDTSADIRSHINPTVTSNVVGIQLGSCKVVGCTNTVFNTFERIPNDFSAELLNSTCYRERTCSIADAYAITFVTITRISTMATNGCFLVVVANKCFNAYTTELTCVVNTVSTDSVKTTVVIVASDQVGSLVVATNRVHWRVVTTQQHLTEAAFQTYYGTAIETTSEITISRVEASFNVEYGRQTVTQVFLAFQAPTGARQVARHQTSCTCFNGSATYFGFSLSNTVASVNNAVQSYGRLCGSSAHSSQSGNSNQRFFHCKFLQG